MRLYLDDDSAQRLLAQLLRKAGHDAQVPADAWLSGKSYPIHLRHAVREQRVCLTHNHDDFEELHELIQETQGRHPGILVVRRDNNPRRDMSAPAIVRAIGKLLAAGLPSADH